MGDSQSALKSGILFMRTMGKYSARMMSAQEVQMQRTFTLEYWLDDGWYVGKLREVPGVFSQGETLDELEENIREAYDLMLEEAVQPQQSGMETKEITIGAE